MRFGGSKLMNKKVRIPQKYELKNKDSDEE